MIRAAIAVVASLATASLVVRVHPLAPVALVFGITVLAVVFRSGFTLLCGFVGVLFLRPAEFVPALAAARPALVLAGTALAMLVIGRLALRDARWPTSPHTPWMGALTLAVLLSSLLGTTPAASMNTFQEVFVKIVLLYVLILMLVDSPARALAMQLVIGGACTVLGVYGMYLRAAGEAKVEGSRAGFVGLLGDPNDLALSLLMAFPFLFEAARVSRGRDRVLFTIGLVAVLGGILSTQSRGGLLGICGAAWLLARHWIPSIPRRVVILGLVGLVGFTAAGVSKRSSGGAGTEGIDESAQGRLDAWKAGGRMLMRRPVLGVGFSSFQDNYASYASGAVIWGKHEAHNSFVKAAAETGLGGLIPFLVLAGRSLVVGVRLRARRRALGESALAQVPAEALLPTLVAFFVSAFFLSQCWNWFTYILIALAAAYERTWLAVDAPRRNESHGTNHPGTLAVPT